MNNLLSGQTILVTRPDPAGKILCNFIDACGGRAIHLPTIEVLPPQDLVAYRKGIALLPTQDWLIFISPQTVYLAAPAIQSAHPFLSLSQQVKIAAPGKGTADALQAHGFLAAAYPVEMDGSEGLLKLSPFQTPQGLKITILRGEGGRELIGSVLKYLGASVLDVIVYRRACPHKEIREITAYLNVMQENPLDVIVGSSFEGIKNLKAMLGEQGWPLIRQVPLIVMNERVKNLAQTLGFETPWVSPSLDPALLVKVIAQKRKNTCQMK